MPDFLKGSELSRRFYHEAVRPLLIQYFPDLPHAAALIGKGSDVLGYDTPMSADHYWGPIIHLFVRNEDIQLNDRIREIMSQYLPATIAAYPVHFGDTSEEAGMDVMSHKAEPPFKHHVFVHTIESFVRRLLNLDSKQPLDAVDWLTVSSQKLLELTSGVVYHDDTGELTALRERFRWYPHDVWLYLLACGWQRIGQEEHLMPRAGFVGDELGSAVIGMRLVQTIMSLCFLMEKRYAPYPKWFGTAFSQLQCASELIPSLRKAQRASTWQERESGLCDAYSLLARMHNALNITEPISEVPSNFYSRPFRVIHGSDVANVIKAQIRDEDVRHIATNTMIGSIDQYCDSTDFFESVDLRTTLRHLYS